jgi:hypothetical protein
VQLRGPARVVAERVDRLADVDTGLAERLAGVEHLEPRQLFGLCSSESAMRHRSRRGPRRPCGPRPIGTRTRRCGHRAVNVRGPAQATSAIDSPVAGCSTSSKCAHRRRPPVSADEQPRLGAGSAATSAARFISASAALELSALRFSTYAAESFLRVLALEQQLLQLTLDRQRILERQLRPGLHRTLDVADRLRRPCSAA